MEEKEQDEEQAAQSRASDSRSESGGGMLAWEKMTQGFGGRSVHKGGQEQVDVSTGPPRKQCGAGEMTQGVKGGTHTVGGKKQLTKVVL